MKMKFKRFTNDLNRKIQSIWSPLLLQIKKKQQSLFFDIKIFWKANKVHVVFQILILIIMITFIKYNLKRIEPQKIPTIQPQVMEFETFLTSDLGLNEMASKIPYKRWKESKIIQIMTLQGPQFLIQVPKLPLEYQEQ